MAGTTTVFAVLCYSGDTLIDATAAAKCIQFRDHFVTFDITDHKVLFYCLSY